MIATVELTEAEMADLRELTRSPDDGAAVRSALDEYRRYARRQRLKELSGQVSMEASWRVAEAVETDGTSSH